MDERLESIAEGHDSSDSGGPGSLRTVVIHRGERGYGLTVSGESPVIVQDVKDGGPAAQAGVKKGDSIIKVNGTIVSQINHKEVVQIIKSTQFVKLTLQSCPEALASPQDPTHRSLPHTPTSSSKSNDRITAPLPVNTLLQNQMDVNKGKMLTKYLEKQRRVRDNIMLELQRNPSKVLQRSLEKELDSINRQITKIQEELKNVKDIDPQSVSSVSEPGSRPPTHYRAKSSPDPLCFQISPGSLSDSGNDVSLSSGGSRGGKVSSVCSEDAASLLMQEPPGTPPPPYAPTSVSSLHYPPSDEMDENYSFITDDCDGGGGGEYYPPSAPPLLPTLLPSVSSCSSRPALPPKPGCHHHISPFSSQLTSPTSPNGQVGHSLNMTGVCSTQPILSMEDEEFSDTETFEDHGPFQSLNKLWNHNAYLAVFMNYIISNCDSSSIFFYVITHLYKEGVGKDMKRWAYEITSSFLLPGAPLRLNVEENILHEIDECLQNELDKEEILRKVFWKARQRCREDLNEQLADFRNKRSAGLGPIFGPPDCQLEETIHNKTKELSIVENLFVPCLESVSDDLKNATDQMVVTASSLATILLKYFGVRSQQAHQLIDRCPLYVSKERPLRSKIFRGSKKQVYRDHHFIQHTYYSVTYCNHCGLIIWGIAPQGYQCNNCEMNIHKSCARKVEEACIGQLHKKDRSRDMKLTSILGKIMPDDNKRKVSQVNPTQIEKARSRYEEANSDILGSLTETDCYTGEKGGSGGLSGNLKEQRRSDPGNVASVLSNNHATIASSSPNANVTSTSSLGGEVNNGSDATEDFGSPDLSSPSLPQSEVPAGRLSAVQQKKKSGANVNRSESLKEKQHSRKRARESRKHSDPNIPTSKSGDVDAESGLNAGHSGSSSNSSLSHSQESPSTSLEQVSSRGESTRTEPPFSAPVLDNDSDIEAEVDLPNWQRLVPSEDIKRLKPKERKRQDTINELFHTERTHVRVLKVVKHLFQVPMTEAELLPKDQLEILFPNLDQMLEIHIQFNQAMKKRRQEEALVNRVGDLVIDMFDGEAGERFQQQAAQYMRTQFLALEGLKTRQKRDQRLANFLQEQENNPACRRLQLKDMLPAGFQRLSKYPLLLESLLSYTDASVRPEEHEQISRALERSREILAFVNNAVEEAENSQRLAEIQRKLDQSSLAKSKHGQSDELRGNLDLTKHKLIYEGPLTWRIAKGQKNIDLLVLLLDEFIVLLQKTDDKYVLKNHSIIKSLSKDENKLTHSPIIKYGPPSMLFRAVATDNCAFFIVTTQAVGAQIYELVASSPSERKVWFRHIQEAQEAYTARDGRRHRPHPSTPLHDPDDQPPPPSDALPDVEDSNVEVEGGEAGSEATGEAADASRTLPSTPRTPEQGKADDAPTQPSPPSPDSLAKKTAEAAGGPGTPTPTPPAPTPGRSPAQGRRLQEVQIIQIVEGPTLIQPSEVKVSQGLVLSAQPVLTPIEHLRRKDLKIRQALREKQLIIADILNIPQEHFESVVDMAGEPSVGNKEPKELVLAAMFQAKCLQETLNEALSINEGDIVAARANSEARPAPSVPLYQAPMSKLMCISTTLSQQLSSLLNLVSERDDERERMRKELVASRERLHQLHMRQNSTPTQAPTTTPVGAQPLPPAVSPHTSRPNSFVSVASSAAEHSDTPEHHDTDEDGSGEGAKVNSTEETDQVKEETIHETFEDAVSGGEATERSKTGDVESSTPVEEGGEEGPGGEEGGGEASTT